jgi:hypothetical protein
VRRAIKPHHGPATRPQLGYLRQRPAPSVVVYRGSSRCAARLARRMARRSSSVVPPQTPDETLLASAHARHGVRTGQARQIRLAWSTCRSAGPVALTGKNRSGLVCRQAA